MTKPKLDRIKKCTRRYQKRRGFSKNKEEPVNKVAIELNTTPETARQKLNTNRVSYDAPPALLVCELPSSPITPTISSRKVDPIISETPREKHNISGYRIVDMEILASVFADILCPNCDTASLVLCDRVSARKGLSSLLYLKCQTRFCLYVKEFSTSTSNVDKSYDVNKRMIYTMRALGQGHSGIEKLTALMNMPRPMTFKNYTNAAKKEATKEVAKKTMDDAATDLHQS